MFWYIVIFSLLIIFVLFYLYIKNDRYIRESELFFKYKDKIDDVFKEAVDRAWNILYTDYFVRNAINGMIITKTESQKFSNVFVKLFLSFFPQRYFRYILELYGDEKIFFALILDEYHRNITRINLEIMASKKRYVDEKIKKALK